MFCTLAFFLTSLALALLCVCAPPAAAEDAAQEAARKAFLVYNIAKFTEWPADRFPGAGEPVAFCVGANSPLKRALSAYPEKFIGPRPVHVVALTKSSDIASCDVLFVDDTLAPQMQKHALDGLYGVMTVSDLPDFIRKGGQVGLYFSGDRLRFRINVLAARKNGISFSSKLLGLTDVSR